MAAELQWDKTGEHYYETGVDRGVLFVWDGSASNWFNGVAWFGLSKVTFFQSVMSSKATILLLPLKEAPYRSPTKIEKLQNPLS